MSAAAFQAAVDRTLGVIGQAFGRPYQGYRITRTASGDFPDGWTKLPRPLALHRNRVTAAGIEVNLLTERTLWYELAGDISAFRLGDVFLPTDGPYVPGVKFGAGATGLSDTPEIDGVSLAWHAPAQPPIGARIDRRVGIYRPTLTPEIMPDNSQRWATSLETNTPLVLTGGRYTWGSPGATASLVPCGFGSNDREFRGGMAQPDQIGIVPAARYFAYLPPLPGYVPSEADIVITEDDARYSVLAPYYQDTGVVGAQLMLERMVSASR